MTSNRLLRIRDQVSAAEYAEDIDDQGVGNYGYDAIGNLVRDDQAGIMGIDWTVYGKIAEIRKVGGHRIRYGYDASGNRISKWVGDSAANRATYTWYVRDAQGNTLSTYSSQGNMATVPAVLTQTDVHLYGSSRIGVMNRGIDAKASLASVDTFLVQRGWKLFEISNHLGNVLATVTDRKQGHSSDGTSIDFYTADVATVSDYYPFGMLMPGRQLGQGTSLPGTTTTGSTTVNGYQVPVDMTVTERTGSEPVEYVAGTSVEFNDEFESLAGDAFEAYIADGSYAGTGNVMGGMTGSAGRYRYGFNGQEMSNEIAGTGNSYTAEFWQYDPRMGRRWNLDPVSNPGLSSYSVLDNSPIRNVDPNGALFFGLFGSTSDQRQAARSTARATGGEVRDKWKRNIHVNYQRVSGDENTPTVTGYSKYFLNDGRSVSKSYREWYYGGGKNSIAGELYDYLDKKQDWVVRPTPINSGLFTDGWGAPHMTSPQSEALQSPILDPIDFIAGGAYGIYSSAVKGAGIKASSSVLLEAFGSDEAIALNVANSISKKGWFDVIIHGTADGAGFTIGREFLTAEQLYSKLLAAGYQQGTRIRLLSCSSGSLENGAAAQLSKLTNAMVVAPTKPMFIGNGALFPLGKPIVEQGGVFKVFKPQ